MQTNPNIKVERQRVNRLTKFLSALHYHVNWKYTNRHITINILRGKEHHSIDLLIEKSTDTHFIYVSSKIVNAAMNDTVNKYLGLDLKFDYSKISIQPETQSTTESTDQSSSQIITKTMLEAISSELCKKDYLIVWDYLDYHIEMLIGNKEEGHTLTFVREDDNLRLTDAYVTSDTVKQIIEKHSNVRIIISDENEEEKSPKQLYMEIDYHLMELHEYIQENNHEKIDSVKDKLSYLHRQLRYAT
jgi:hypothetical protein